MRALRYNMTKNLHFVRWSGKWPTISLTLVAEYMFETPLNNCYRWSGRVAQDIGEVSAAIRIFQAELQN